MTPTALFRTAAIVAAAGALYAGSALAAPIDTVPPAEPTESGSPDVGDPQDGIVHSFTLVPASEDGGPSTRSNFAYTAAPGAVISDAVTVMNLGNEGLPFRIYSTDAFNNDDGDFTLLSGDDVATDVGSWLQLENDTVFLPPRSQVTIPFTLTVPEAAAAGDHAGAVLASSPTIARGDLGEQVTVDRRVGPRLFVRVAGPVEPDLAIENLTSGYVHAFNSFSGTEQVEFRIENRGNVRLSGAYEVEVAGPGGIGKELLEPVPFEELLPGETFDVAVDVGGIPAAFRLATKVSLVNVTQGDGTEIDADARSTATFAPPVTMLLVVLLALFVLVAIRAHRRHRVPDIEVISPRDDRELQPT